MGSCPRWVFLAFIQSVIIIAVYALVFWKFYENRSASRIKETPINGNNSVFWKYYENTSASWIEETPINGNNSGFYEKKSPSWIEDKHAPLYCVLAALAGIVLLMAVKGISWCLWKDRRMGW